MVIGHLQGLMAEIVLTDRTKKEEMAVNLQDLTVDLEYVVVAVLVFPVGQEVAGAQEIAEGLEETGALEEVVL